MDSSNDMFIIPEEQANDSLQAQTFIWNHAFRFITSAVLKCIIDLGIPDIIHSHGKPMALTELVAALPTIHPSKSQHVFRMMRLLIHAGVFVSRQVDESSEDRYELTPSAHYLLSSNPFSMKAFMLGVLDPICVKPWSYLSTWFQIEDETVFETAHGMDMWELAKIDPRFNKLFNDYMACDAMTVISVVLNNYTGVFAGLDRLVDVGGGTGTVAKAIASAFPDTECVNFDQPHVIAGLEDSENLKHVGGDMFEFIPPADAIVLKWILHDWDDEICIKILNKCKKALQSNRKKGGKLIIIDAVVNNQTDNREITETQLFWDIRMMVNMPGKEREEKEWAKLFKDSGFTKYKMNHVLGPRSLIEVYP